MITPIRILSKKEVQEMQDNIREMGRTELVLHLLGLGWSKESSESLADTMLKAVERK